MNPSPISNDRAWPYTFQGLNILQRQIAIEHESNCHQHCMLAHRRVIGLNCYRPYVLIVDLKWLKPVSLSVRNAYKPWMALNNLFLCWCAVKELLTHLSVRHMYSWKKLSDCWDSERYDNNGDPLVRDKKNSAVWPILHVAQSARLLWNQRRLSTVTLWTATVDERNCETSFSVNFTITI